MKLAGRDPVDEMAGAISTRSRLKSAFSPCRCFECHANNAVCPRPTFAAAIKASPVLILTNARCAAPLGGRRRPLATTLLCASARASICSLRCARNAKRSRKSVTLRALDSRRETAATGIVRLDIGNVRVREEAIDQGGGLCAFGEIGFDHHVICIEAAQ